MANDTLLNTPTLWINKYLQTKIAGDIGFGVPFFPSVPSTIEDLTNSFVVLNTATLSQTDVDRYAYAGVMATWDRMFRMSRSPFPHKKEEQILYYFYATEEDKISNLIQTTEAVRRLLDRGDESAEELNNWCSNRQVNLGTEESPDLIDNMFYFHELKVYQLEEVRDIIDFGTARTYAGNKLIIDYCYHSMPDLTNHNWAPESKLATKIVI